MFIWIWSSHKYFRKDYRSNFSNRFSLFIFLLIQTKTFILFEKRNKPFMLIVISNVPLLMSSSPQKRQFVQRRSGRRVVILIADLSGIGSFFLKKKPVDKDFVIFRKRLTRFLPDRTGSYVVNQLIVVFLCFARKVIPWKCLIPKKVEKNMRRTIKDKGQNKSSKAISYRLV